MRRYPFPVSSTAAFMCGNWHSGQTSSLYSIASTGLVHSPKILRGALAELRWLKNCLPGRVVEDDLELVRLGRLLHRAWKQAQYFMPPTGKSAPHEDSRWECKQLGFTGLD